MEREDVVVETVYLAVSGHQYLIAVEGAPGAQRGPSGIFGVVPLVVSPQLRLRGCSRVDRRRPRDSGSPVCRVVACLGTPPCADPRCPPSRARIGKGRSSHYEPTERRRGRQYIGVYQGDGALPRSAGVEHPASLYTSSLTARERQRAPARDALRARLGSG